MPASQTTMDSQASAVQEPAPVQLHNLNLETAQPPASQAMDPMKPHAETERGSMLGLRGGELCPGRFCFCVPCPLPCDCCII